MLFSLHILIFVILIYYMNYKNFVWIITKIGYRGDLRPSPLKGLSPHYRDYRPDSGSLTRGSYGLHHAQTDPGPLNSGKASNLEDAYRNSGKNMVDDGYSSLRHGAEVVIPPPEIKHDRAGSKDSADYALHGELCHFL